MPESVSTNGNGSTPTLPKIGVYICHCGLNIASKVDIAAVVAFAKSLPHVTVAREYKYMCADPGQELIVDDLREGRVDRIVVASCSPLMHEATFRRAAATGGANPFLFQMANIREHVSWVTADNANATLKARALVAGAVRRVALHVPLERKRVPVHPDALVVGGGIAGIHAALTLADAGKKVTLVEREPTIGGHMAQFDKTFPTLDCAACILTPKMMQVRAHPNITMLTYSEVEKVDGFVGNFTVTVRRKARYVREDLCTGCDSCRHMCPVSLPSEFDVGLAPRRAIYRAFPQAVPNTFTITRKGVPPCQTACPIHQNAHGYLTLVADDRFKKAMELIVRDNPLPSVCGRVCSRPCETSCTRREVDEAVAIRAVKRTVLDRARKVELPGPLEERGQSVAIVGAGPAGLTCAYDLRRRGYTPVVYDMLPVAGGSLATTIPEFRLPRAVLATEIERLGRIGIQFQLNSRVGDSLPLATLQARHDAVFLAVGAPASETNGLPGAQSPGVWGAAELLRRLALGEKDLVRPRVLVIGGDEMAVDAARLALRCGAAQVTVLAGPAPQIAAADPEEVREAEAEGVHFARDLTPASIIPSAGALEVACRKANQEGATALTVDQVILSGGRRPDVAGLGARDGLRATPSGTLEADPLTLESGVPGLFAGGECVGGPMNVVYAMAAGRKAAISIHRYLNHLDMRSDRELEGPYPSTIQTDTTGQALKPRLSVPARPLAERRGLDEVQSAFSKEQARAEAARCLDCAICCDCQLCATVCEPKAIDFSMRDELREIKVGTIILATGFQPFDATRISRYGYGIYPNVYTALQVERMVNASGPGGGEIQLADGSKPKTVGIIHCVGSRDENTNKYCSRVCCMYSLKLAHLLRERTGAEVYNFYIDMRTPGKGYEEFYDKLLREGVHFIRGRVAEVNDWALTPEEKGRLVIRAEDTLIGTMRRIPVDMVVLAVGLEPQADAEEVRRRFNISCSHEGWFMERHPKLAPVSTFTDGVFLAGACQGPKDIPDSVAQAGAAAAESLSLIDRVFVELEPNTAYVVPELCSGCKTCISLCPFSALSSDPVLGKVVLNEALCKGCGTCVAACPSGALQQHLFTDEEIYQEIEGVLSYV
jgi:heterodisulfide reductase subunit A